MSLSSKCDRKNGYRYLLEFPNGLRVYVDDACLLSNILDKYTVSVSPGSRTDQPSQEAKKTSSVSEILEGGFCPECGSTDLARDSQSGETVCMTCGLGFGERKSQAPYSGRSKQRMRSYRICDEGDRYRIFTKGRSQRQYVNNVHKETVESIYQHLKMKGGRLTALQIEDSLNLAIMTIHNALKVLIFQGRAKFERVNGKRQLLYEVSENHRNEDLTIHLSSP